MEQLRTNGERLVKEMEKLYDVELLRLPVALRELNWLEFFGSGGRGGLPLKRRSEAVAEERWDAALLRRRDSAPACVAGAVPAPYRGVTLPNETSSF